MKRIKNILFAIFLFYTCILKTYASEITINSTSTSIYRGETITITATIQADSGIYTTSGSIYCSGGGINNGIDLTSEDMNTKNKSITRSIKLTPTASGTVTCKTADVKIRELAKEKEYSLKDSSITIEVKNRETQGEKNETTKEKKEYDKDNTLKTLEVENYHITPEFAKDITEYQLEVDEQVEKVNIKAEKNSEKASLQGVGEVNLTPGKNTIIVKVTAENGNEKEYKILITVKDLNPVTLKINKEDYTLVKKNNNILEKPQYFEEEIIKIKEQDTISYINKTTNLRLVILKDKNNKPGYYIYNEINKQLTKYYSITVGNIALQVLEAPNILKHYQKYAIEVGEEILPIYKIKKENKIGLIYGTNLKTGNTGYYVYDSKEETLSKYYNEEAEALKKEILELKNKTMLFMGIVSSMTMIIIMVSIIKSIKRKKALNY